MKHFRRTGLAALVLMMVIACAATMQTTLAYVIDRTAAHTNTFVLDPSIVESTVKIEIEKTMMNLGTNHTGPDGFNFLVYDAESGEKVAVLTTNQKGHAEMTLRFGMADAGKRYSFTVQEEEGGIPGMKYSDAVYLVEISIGTDARFTPAVRVNGEEVQSAVLRYTNIYNADHIVGRLPSAPPATGDSTPIVLCIAMMMLSIVGAAWAVKKSKKA